MIEIDGLNIDYDQYGNVIVTLPDGKTLIEQGVTQILLYELLSLAARLLLVQANVGLKPIAPDLMKLPEKKKRGRAKA